MLQEHDGALNFATDAWTSPNHKAFVAVTVHLENNGIPLCILLDLVEVAKSHSGLNLAAAFAKILDDFGISDKVCQKPTKNFFSIHLVTGRSFRSLATMHQTVIQ